MKQYTTCVVAVFCSPHFLTYVNYMLHNVQGTINFTFSMTSLPTSLDLSLHKESYRDSLKDILFFFERDALFKSSFLAFKSCLSHQVRLYKTVMSCALGNLFSFSYYGAVFPGLTIAEFIKPVPDM